MRNLMFWAWLAAAFVVASPVVMAGKGGTKGKPGGGGGGEDPPSSSIEYEITYVGLLDGSEWNFLNAVNANGDAVGQGGATQATPDGEYSNTPARRPMAIFWDHSAQELIAVNDLLDPAEGWQMELATDINDVGEIVGYGNRDTDGDGRLDSTGYALLFQPDADGDGYGTIVDLTGPTGNNTRPTAISEDGDVVGWHNDGENGFRGFVWSAQRGLVLLPGPIWRMVDIGNRDGNGLVTLVANEWPTPTAAYAASFDPGDTSASAPVWTDLGFGYESGSTAGESQASAIGPDDAIIGYTSADRSAYWAARYTSSAGWEIYGTLGRAGGKNQWNDSTAKAVNVHGDVVGDSHAGSSDRHAFLYREGDGMLDLTSLITNAPSGGVELGTPTGINDSGLISGPAVGNYHEIEGTEGYILTPVPSGS